MNLYAVYWVNLLSAWLSCFFTFTSTTFWRQILHFFFPFFFFKLYLKALVTCYFANHILHQSHFYSIQYIHTEHVNIDCKIDLYLYFWYLSVFIARKLRLILKHSQYQILFCILVYVFVNKFILSAIRLKKQTLIPIIWIAKYWIKWSITPIISQLIVNNIHLNIWRIHFHQYLNAFNRIYFTQVLCYLYEVTFTFTKTSLLHLLSFTFTK